MDRLDAMHIFTRVAELTSFTRAADSLGLPKASISTSIQQLESRLGVQLLHRTTRKVHLTPDGEVFYHRCKDLLAEADDVHSMFQRGPASISGRLRVDMPIALARTLVIPSLPAFLGQHPQLNIELSTTDRKVDLVSEGFDCVVRIGALDDSALVARSLGKLALVNCASPDYLQRRGEPRTLDALAQHVLVNYVAGMGGKASGFEYMQGERSRHISMPHSISVNSTDSYAAACLAGLGIAQIPAVGARPLLAAGLLCEILPDYQAPPMPVAMLYAHRRNVSKRVQVFMDWLAGLVQQYTD